jgi:uncharacterized protein YuzE
MKVVYDRETDTLVITLSEARIRESTELRPGVVVDLDFEGNVVRFEVLRASSVVEKATEMQFLVEA